MPKVNIITATHNRGYVLPRVASCIFNQTQDSWRWIIVDDASFDEAPDIIKNLSNQEKIEYFRFDTKVGQVNAKNKGLELADKDSYIHILDDDDVIYPNFHERMIKEIKESDVIFCNFYVVKEYLQGSVLLEMGREIMQNWEDFVPGKQKEHPYININRCLFRPGFFNDYDWFPTDEPFCIEWFMLLEAELKGAKFKYLDEILGENHWREGWTDNVSFTKSPLDIKGMLSRQKELVEKYECIHGK